MYTKLGVRNTKYAEIDKTSALKELTFCDANSKQLGKLINKIISEHYQYYEEESTRGQ